MGLNSSQLMLTALGPNLQSTFPLSSRTVKSWIHRSSINFHSIINSTNVYCMPTMCPLDCKEIQPVHPKGDQSWFVYWKDWCWSWNSSTLATWCEELTHWKRPWCWEGLWAGGEGDDRGWDGWMASLTQWTWVWVNSGNWWWTGRPGVLRFMGSQRVGHDWETELNWTMCQYFWWWFADISKVLFL